MASKMLIQILFALLLSSLTLVSSGRILTASSEEGILLFKYHNGPLLTGNISINLIWYGKFRSSQKAIVADFITSLVISSSQTTHNHQVQPSVATWWSNIEKFYTAPTVKTKKSSSSSSSSLQLSLGTQTDDVNYALGKSLKMQQIQQLAAAAKGTDLSRSTNINVVLTSSDVAVEGFCSSKCGTHGSLNSKKLAYIWVGNSETQCPGQCAWPFHQPIYGPQSPPLVAPNNDVGLDGMVINLAALLAGTVTNPFGSGYYQGPAEAPLEASSACPGIYAKGAYPGYAGNLLVDSTNGASFNAHGTNGRKYLLPALYDPSTSTCSTLV